MIGINQIDADNFALVVGSGTLELNAIINEISNFAPKLKFLTVRFPQTNGGHIAAGLLAALPSVEEFALSGASFGDDDVFKIAQAVSQHRKLNVLSFGAMNQGFLRILPIITQCRNLRCLNVKVTPFDVLQPAPFAALPNLIQLHIVSDYMDIDMLAKTIEGCQQLKSLTVYNLSTFNVPLSSWSFLSNFRLLEQIVFLNFGLSYSDGRVKRVQHLRAIIQACPNLNSLGLLKSDKLISEMTAGLFDGFFNAFKPKKPQYKNKNDDWIERRKNPIIGTGISHLICDEITNCLLTEQIIAIRFGSELQSHIFYPGMWELISWLESFAKTGYTCSPKYIRDRLKLISDYPKTFPGFYTPDLASAIDLLKNYSPETMGHYLYSSRVCRFEQNNSDGAWNLTNLPIEIADRILMYIKSEPHLKMGEKVQQRSK